MLLLKRYAQTFVVTLPEPDWIRPDMLQRFENAAHSTLMEGHC